MHLKRFNCVNNKWVKSQKAVNFPFENFDPTPYLAAIPQETILRHRELREAKGLQLPENVKATMRVENINGDIIEKKTDKKIGDNNENIIDNVNSQYQNENGQEHIINNSLDNTIYTNTLKEITLQQQAQLLYDEINCNNCDTELSDHKANNCDTKKYRQRVISTSLDKSPIIDNEFQDFHEHKLKSNEDKFDPKYKLYAVVVSKLFVFLNFYSV